MHCGRKRVKKRFTNLSGLLLGFCVLEMVHTYTRHLCIVFNVLFSVYATNLALFIFSFLSLLLMVNMSLMNVYMSGTEIALRYMYTLFYIRGDAEERERSVGIRNIIQMRPSLSFMIVCEIYFIFSGKRI